MRICAKSVNGVSWLASISRYESSRLDLTSLRLTPPPLANPHLFGLATSSLRSVHALGQAIDTVVTLTLSLPLSKHMFPRILDTEKDLQYLFVRKLDRPSSWNTFICSLFDQHDQVFLYLPYTSQESRQLPTVSSSSSSSSSSISSASSSVQSSLSSSS